MRLLVSVRSHDEVTAALRGGADIVDAKDPSRGPLGPVAAHVLARIDAELPGHVPLSVALGDVASAEAVAASLASCRIAARPVTYMKLGVEAALNRREIESVLEAAAAAAARHPAGPRLVAVAYADRSRQADEVLEAATRAHAAAVLLDTAAKNGRTLLDVWPEARLRGWVGAARAAGLEVALAGSLGSGDLPRVSALGPDIVGVRGAACVGGRGGSVDETRVRALRARLPVEPATIAANHHTAPVGSTQPSISK